MKYEKTGLRLDVDPSNKDIMFSELFGITEERATFLDKRVSMAKQIIVIEDDAQRGIDYFMSECVHANEAAYCWLKVGQKCDCSSMRKVSAFASDGSGPSLPGIIVEILSKMGGKGPTSKD
jgi:hypothetical protein